MKNAFNIYDLITASVFVLNIFVAAIFFVRNFKVSLTHKLISFILFLLLLRTFSIHLYLSREIVNFPHYILVNHIISRIGLPILFLMLVFEVYQRKFKWYDSLHFIPFFLFVLNYADLLAKTAAEKVEIINKMYTKGHDIVWSEGSFLTTDMVFLIRIVPFFIYVFAMIFILFWHKKSKLLSESLKDFFTALIIYMVINLVAVIFSDILHLFNENSVYETNIIAFVSTLFMLVYFFFIPNFIYHPYFVKQIEVKNAVKKPNTYKIATHNHLEKIEQYFNLHKSFLNADYTITQLESEIKIPSRQISKAIKLIRNQNFNQFLNEFRINYLLQQVTLETAIHTNFQDLAYQVGFNSVNNFYTHFKNYVGCTPKVYYDKLKKEQEARSKSHDF
jgi:AraC-like DNA-binding protein